MISVDEVGLTTETRDVHHSCIPDLTEFDYLVCLPGEWEEAYQSSRSLSQTLGLVENCDLIKCVQWLQTDSEKQIPERN